MTEVFIYLLMRSATHPHLA